MWERLTKHHVIWFALMLTLAGRSSATVASTTVWSNADGTRSEYVPRHSEVNELVAKAILKSAGE